MVVIGVHAVIFVLPNVLTKLFRGFLSLEEAGEIPEPLRVRILYLFTRPVMGDQKHFLTVPFTEGDRGHDRVLSCCDPVALGMHQSGHGVHAALREGTAGRIGTSCPMLVALLLMLLADMKGGRLHACETDII
ncbi:hypothetical protein WL08_16785 [Burkholderia ubonensis]|uniref:Uncharacterized protein n=1 Tax=Burkholderia ubonensis TaxID=101571 RepID=A0ABD6Q1Z2_9BURK|nr:hypothetical protein WK51_30530 [Burkholderia ubonensis]KVX75942.1 hypothetical protein WL08_16785 [Burkholderia ubonensis]KVZ03517.1 hypothetical protein WL11_16350 [Burkholderia ubonensis]OJA46009.1 hypothetical protein BGV66_17780 [Burkholderia ubonensis]